jgi:glycosyltransferase involved in cell wall biosynthesis
MKIGFDARDLIGCRTGVGRYLLNLVNALSNVTMDNEYHLYTHKKLEEKLFDDTQNVHIKNINGYKYLWKNIFFPISLLSDKIDLVHIPSYSAMWFPPCKSVVTIHDMIFAKHPEWAANKKQYIRFKYYVKKTAKKADAIIVVSKTSKKEVIELTGVPEEKIYVTYLAADKIYKVQDNIDKLGRIKQKYSFDKKYILYVGSIHPRRNLERLLKSFALLKKRTNVPHNLLLVGLSFSPKEKLFQKAKELDLEKDIKYLGYVPDEDLVSLYNFADIFVYPSLYEGFGIPVLEAMACGTPVITSNISSLPEVSGDAAYLIDPYSIEEIYSAMQSILFNKEVRNKLVKKGFERTKNFDWKKTAEQTFYVFNEVMQ